MIASLFKFNTFRVKAHGLSKNTLTRTDVEFPLETLQLQPVEVKMQERQIYQQKSQ